jgi:hypothetical protein
LAYFGAGKAAQRNYLSAIIDDLYGEKSMIIIAFSNGLGNQMHMYAIYMALKETYPNQAFKIDILTHDWGVGTYHWHGYKYVLGKYFGLELPEATAKEIKAISPCVVVSPWFRKLFPGTARKIQGYSMFARVRANLLPSYRKRKNKNFIRESLTNIFNGNVFDLDPNGDYYVYGYWQNINYVLWPNIEHKVRNTFKLRSIILNDADRLLLEEIKTTTSIAIHVRVSDASLKVKDHHSVILKTTKINYYKKAIEIMNDELEKQGVYDPHYFIFSNNKEYCQEEFSFVSNAKYIGHAQDECNIDMLLMSKCSHAISSSGTFSFWSIFITDSDTKIVICPKYHIRSKDGWIEMSVPERWIKVDNMKLNLKNTEIFKM